VQSEVPTLISARWVVPVEPAGTVLEHHSVAVRDGAIEAVLPTPQALEAYPGHARVDLPEHVLIPGLVNLHTHAAMTLMRGMADDLALMRWLQDHIWPAEAEHVSAQFVRDGTLLACAEMLRGGITCFNDMYFYPEAALDSALHSGMRAAFGMIVIDFPTGYASDPDDYLAKGLAVRDKYRDHPLFSFCLAPHAPYTVSDRTFGRVATTAAELDCPIHCHVHETQDEVARSVAEHGVRPLERLRRLGIVGPNLVSVHSVHLTPGEIAMLADHGSSVAHCPSSNLKLASGFAPVAALVAAGVNVGLGTDGAASNNRLDAFQEMRQAALLAKAVAGDAEAIPAHKALEMATLAGARALGLDGRIGSIVPGKRADLAAVSLAGPEATPVFDPVSHLVYCVGREQVSHVWVDGHPKMVDRALKHLDIPALDTRVKLWQNALNKNRTES
jgi:5-methylthioadenosine/S-adenosylhomocysteine deaminase